MKLMSLKLIIVMAVLSHTNVLLADSFTPSHSCFKPKMPSESLSRSEAASLNDDIDRYKQCILDFVDEQNAAMTNHQESAQSAIDEWNRFVKKNGLGVSK